jgi:3-oxoacyl-[acyl-carrier protein] reductase
MGATTPIPTTRELEGRAALVTGSANNIGRAIALALADAGASVLVHARVSREEAEETVRLVRARNARAELALADIRDPAQCRGLVETAVKAFGRLDILVNNASKRHQTPVLKITPEEWRDIFATTVESAFFLAQAAMPHLKASGQGAIINLGGISAHGGVAGRVHAATSKGATVAMCRALAADLAPDNITVNCVAPGHIDTIRGASAGGPAGRPSSMVSNLAGRMGEPSEIAAMVRLLAGPGGRFITGQTIHVNGGQYMGA